MPPLPPSTARFRRRGSLASVYAAAGTVGAFLIRIEGTSEAERARALLAKAVDKRAVGKISGFDFDSDPAPIMPSGNTSAAPAAPSSSAGNTGAGPYLSSAGLDHWQRKFGQLPHEMSARNFEKKMNRKVGGWHVSFDGTHYHLDNAQTGVRLASAERPPSGGFTTRENVLHAHLVQNAQPAATQPNAGGLSLFDEPAPAAPAAPATNATNQEFENKHPRGNKASTGGAPQTNPKTGKTIRPGEFAPKDETAAMASPSAPAPQQEASDDEREPATERTGRAGRGASAGKRARAQELEGGLFGQPENEPAGPVRPNGSGRQPGADGDGAGGGGALDVRQPDPAGREPGRGQGGSDAGKPADLGQSDNSVGGTELNRSSEPGKGPDAGRAPVVLLGQELRQNTGPQKTGSDYRITELDEIGAGGPREKYARNVAAIRILNDLYPVNPDTGERAKVALREATLGEKAALVQYSGWGWTGNQLFHQFNDEKYDGMGSYYTQHQNEWKDEYRELKGLLTESEFKDARATTLNAHYTSPEVIRAMWEGVRHLGFEGGRVLEPACGAGHFIGCMPPDLWAKSAATGVEIDPTTAHIAQQLYSSSNVLESPFEKAALPDGFFDLAISNVPFGNYGVYDPVYDKPGMKKVSDAIHNYFFAKALDKVKEGGLVAFITSRYTMDAADGAFREYIAGRADLLGAVRLPNTAFAGNAGTQVVTDVIFLRKRAPGDAPAGEAWTGTRAIDVVSEAAGGAAQSQNVNEYFAANPERMLGTPASVHGQYRANEFTLKGDGRDLGPALADALKANLPAGLCAPPAPVTSADKESTDALVAPLSSGAPLAHLPGAFVLVGGAVHQQEADGLHALDFKPNKGGTAPKHIAVIKDMIPLKENARALLKKMSDPAVSDEEVKGAQAAFGRKYEAFVAQHGFLHTEGNLRHCCDDPDYALLLAFEDWDDAAKVGRPGKAFAERTNLARVKVQHADTPEQAMLLALAEHGKLHWDYMGGLTGHEPEALQAHLESQGHVYHNPLTSDFETADSYLSGNVRVKLREAEAAAKQEPRYQRNADALRAVLPADLLPHEISVGFGVDWVPPKIVKQFLDEHLLGLPAHQSADEGYRLRYFEKLGRWTVEAPKRAHWETERAGKWSTDRKWMHDLVECALNLSRPTVTDPHPTDEGKRIPNKEETQAAVDKVAQIKDAWKKWVWSDEARAQELTAYYNEHENGMRDRAFDGQHLTLPGISGAALANLKPHVKDVVWRMLQSPNTLTAHCVGAGKSWQFACAAMEKKRLGLAKKPLITVPNHVVPQFAAEFKQLYPQANVLMVTKDDFSPVNRRRLMARIATGNWDAVVIAHSQFGRIAISPEAEERFRQEHLNDLDAAIAAVKEEDPKSKTVKRLENYRKKEALKFEKVMGRRKEKGGADDFMTLEDLGVDNLFVDEAHEYKNLGFATQMTNIRGLNPIGSNRAFDMHMKCRVIQGMNAGGGGVQFATGTPIANSIGEAHGLLRYLAPEILRQKGLDSFDSWARRYGDIVSGTEVTASGKMKEVERFSQFQNAPELASQLRVFADIKNLEDLPHLKVPQAERVPVYCTQSADQESYTRELQYRAECIAGEHGKELIPDPHDDNMLKVCSDARRNLLDARLVDPTIEDHSDSKINQCVAKVHDEWDKSHANRATQMIFLDMGTPKTSAEDADQKAAMDAAELAGEEVEGVRSAGARARDMSEEAERQAELGLYHDIRQKLIARGVPAAEIAFIHDADTEEKKLVLQRDMKAGKIRVLLSSTQKGGTGLNVQDRMVALHHLDCPWRPADLAQREGRIVRQGNKHLDWGLPVRVFNYLGVSPAGNPTMDAFFWQKIQQKQHAINQMMKGDPNVRVIEDVAEDEMTPAQFKARCSGNPLLEKELKVAADVQKYRALEANFLRRQGDAETRRRVLPNRIEQGKAHVGKLTDLIAHRDANKPELDEKGKPQFLAHLDGQYYNKSADAGAAILNAERSQPIGWTGRRHLGHYHGFALDLVGRGQQNRPVVELARDHAAAAKGDEAKFVADLGDTPEGTISRVRNAVAGLDKMREAHEYLVGRDEQNLAELQNAPGFPHAQKLADLETELAAIHKQMTAEAQANAAPKADPPAEGPNSVMKGMSYVGGKWYGNAPGVAPSGTLAKVGEAARGVASSVGQRLEMAPVRGLNRAAKDLGMKHYESRMATSAPGVPSVGGASSFSHRLGAADAGAAARGLRNHLRMNGYKVSGTALSPAAGAADNSRVGAFHHTITATAKDGATHTFAVEHRPWLAGDTGKRGAGDAPPLVKPAARSLGEAPTEGKGTRARAAAGPAGGGGRTRNLDGSRRSPAAATPKQPAAVTTTATATVAAAPVVNNTFDKGYRDPDLSADEKRAQARRAETQRQPAAATGPAPSKGGAAHSQGGPAAADRIHEIARTHDLVHVSSTNQNVGGGLLGGPRRTDAQHFFTHRNPMRQLALVHHALKTTDHQVSGVRQRTVPINGRRYHEYSLEARAPGGERHTIRVIRSDARGASSAQEAASRGK